MSLVPTDPPQPPEKPSVKYLQQMTGGIVGLPTRPFLYTLDQIALLLNITQRNLEENYVYFEGRSVGKPSPHEMRARNIAGWEGKPDWRVSERSLVIFLKRRGFKYYDRGTIQ